MSMFGYLFLVCFAVFYYRVAEMENRSGFLWALISIALYVGAGFLGLGVAWTLAVQAVPFGLMLWLNMRND